LNLLVVNRYDPKGFFTTKTTKTSQRPQRIKAGGLSEFCETLVCFFQGRLVKTLQQGYKDFTKAATNKKPTGLVNLVKSLWLKIAAIATKLLPATIADTTAKGYFRRN